MISSTDFHWISDSHIDVHTSTYYHFKDRFMQAILPPSVEFADVVAMGIDPGRRFGVCTIRQNEINVMEAWFDDASPEIYAKWAAEYMRNHYHWCVDWPITIEGAAYRKRYGQVGLAYIRMGFYLPMVRIARPQIVPPASIRKVAFGSGKTKAKEVWPNLPTNAAAAVGCALHAAGVTIDTTEHLQ